jgi:hypothetical protein
VRTGGGRGGYLCDMMSLAGSVRLCVACIVGAVAAMAGGCGTAPKVEVVSASLGEVTDSAVQVKVNLKVTSEAEEALPLKLVHYTVTLEGGAGGSGAGGAGSFKGTRVAESVLPKKGGVALVLPASMLMSMGSGELRYTITGELTYVRQGPVPEWLYDMYLSRPSVAFSGSGVVGAAAAAPAASPAAVLIPAATNPAGGPTPAGPGGG